jgi:hypothetical protein
VPTIPYRARVRGGALSLRSPAQPRRPGPTLLIAVEGVGIITAATIARACAGGEQVGVGDESRRDQAPPR